MESRKMLSLQTNSHKHLFENIKLDLKDKDVTITIKGKEIPQSYWSEAIYSAVYVTNITGSN